MNAQRTLHLCVLISLLFGLSLSGCVSKKQLKWDGVTEGTYRSHVRHWTRTDQIYDGIVARSSVKVTCFSPTFAGILQNERANRSRLDSETAHARLERAKEEARKELVFFVALHTQNHFWNDLDRPKPTFTVKLQHDNGPSQKPSRIVRLGENEMADWSTLFPTVSPLDTGYFVAFQAPIPQQKVRLLISGDPGAMDLYWNIAP